MIGEFTEKARTYEQIAKSNGMELTKELKDTITDYLVYEEQLIEAKVKTEKEEKIIEKLREINEFKQYVKENLGGFYFDYYNRLSGKLEPQYMVRFLYLCSFMNYENILVIRKKRHIAITENQLSSILKLGKRETIYTKQALIDNNLISIDEDKCIKVNDKYCKKGDIMKSKNDIVRVFNNSIVEIYNKTKPNEHKKLALLFELLPYVNLKYNMVCKNVEEELLEKIEPYTLKELALLFNKNNITRFKNSLLGLTVDGQEVVMLHVTGKKTLISINPKVYYKGVNLDGLEYLDFIFNASK